MSASYFRTLFGYSRWAWTKVLDRVAELSKEEYEARNFNFGSVRSTLVHVCRTETMYLARLTEQPAPQPLTEESTPTFEALRKHWEGQFEAQKRFAESLSDAAVNESFTYTGANGREQSNRRDLFLAQFFNHSTQHRAETAVAITEFGHSPGDLDVSMYVRESGPQ